MADVVEEELVGLGFEGIPAWSTVAETEVLQRRAHRQEPRDAHIPGLAAQIVLRWYLVVVYVVKRKGLETPDEACREVEYRRVHQRLSIMRPGIQIRVIYEQWILDY